MKTETIGKAIALYDKINKLNDTLNTLDANHPNFRLGFILWNKVRSKRGFFECLPKDVKDILHRHFDMIYEEIVDLKGKYEDELEKL